MLDPVVEDVEDKGPDWHDHLPRSRPLARLLVASPELSCPQLMTVLNCAFLGVGCVSAPGPVSNLATVPCQIATAATFLFD